MFYVVTHPRWIDKSIKQVDKDEILHTYTYINSDINIISKYFQVRIIYIILYINLNT